MLFEKIVKLCEERKITIAKLERECGFGNATLRGWKEYRPKADTLKKVAEYFGVTMEELMEE